MYPKEKHATANANLPGPGGRGPELHAAAQAPPPAAAQHEDRQDDRQLLQRGVPGRSRDLPRAQ